MMLEDQDCLKLFPIRSARGTVRLPGSKSISNRALLLAALSEGTCRLQGVLRADDTGRMLDALRTLGVEVLEDPGDPTSFAVTGCGGRFPVRNADIFLGNAGTAARPLTAALALQGGSYRLATLVGPARAKEMFFTGRKLSAREAYEWGIVNHVVPDDELDSCLHDILSMIRSNDRQVQKFVKNFINERFCSSMPMDASFEAISSSVCLNSEGTARRLSDFFASRKKH